MRISTKGRYAIRMMLDIAQHSGEGNVSLKDVSKRQGISLKYLEQIVNMLSKAGFLRSQRGAQGGYKMVKKPEEYTIGDILRITEGELAPVACLEDDANRCERASACQTLSFWEGLYSVINEYLDSTTIADLAASAAEDDADIGCYI